MNESTIDESPVSAQADGSHIPYSQLKGLIGNLLTRSHAVMRKQFLVNFAEEELSPTLLATLSLIISNGGCTQSSIAREFGIDRSAIVGLIDRLEKRQLVERQSIPDSRRAYALHVTDQGRRFYDAAVGNLMRFEERMFSEFSKREYRELARLLSKFIATAAVEPDQDGAQE